MSHPSPPRVATWLLGRAVPESNRDAVLGDLAEEYALRARSRDGATVSRWYWGQVCRSIPSVMWDAIRSGRWLSTFGVALGAYIFAGIVEFGATTAISRVLAPNSSVFTVISLIVGLATMTLGGYLAARIRPAAVTALAGIVMIVVAVLMVTVSGSAPLWYGLAFLIVGPLAALAGGALGRGRRTRGAGRAV
jgi:hypothetical protein